MMSGWVLCSSGVFMASGTPCLSKSVSGFGVHATIGWWVGFIDMLLLGYFLASHAGQVVTLLLDASQCFMHGWLGLNVEYWLKSGFFPW